MSQKPAKSSGSVAALERGLSILAAFREGDRALTLKELAQRTGFYKSTILRLACSLERFNCLTRGEDGRYQLGPMLLHWGNLYQRSLKIDDHVLPVLERLVRDTGESASFYIRKGKFRVCLFRVDSPRSVRDHVHVGDLLPLDVGAAGRVLMTFDPSAKSPAESVVIATFGERDAETAAIAAPVFGPADALLGALSLSGPITRFSDAAVAVMSPTLVEAAAHLTDRLGGNPSKLVQPAKRTKSR